MPNLVLVAPLSGPMLPLEDVPDPVFAGKLVGDGVSIDPVTSTLLAPCDGELLFVHPSGHALTLATAGGVEIILHIGLDTVSLRGEGFLPLKARGDRVRVREPLIEFAPDYVATHAASLLTQIIIATPDRITGLTKRGGYVDAGRDVILEASLSTGISEPAASEGGRLSSPELLVEDPTGLHARPAAVLSASARQFKSDIRVRSGTREANARSVTSIMALEIAGGERIVITAAGPDAREALETIVPLVQAGLAPPASARADLRPAGRAPEPAPAAGMSIWSARTRVLRGVAASPGVAIGQVALHGTHDLPAMQAAGTPDEERATLQRALEQARQQLLTLSEPSGSTVVQAGIFRAHLELLDDPDLVEFSWELIAHGTGAAAAWHRAFSRLADRMAGARSDVFAQRADDVRDVGRRVLRLLAGVHGGDPVYPEDAIVVADLISPSEAAAFDRSRVRGFCTVSGGRTSHVAIIARSLGIPAVTGIDPSALQLEPGTHVILDGITGTLLVDPDDSDQAAAAAALARTEADRAASTAAAFEAAITVDGSRIEVAANVGGEKDAVDGMALGADGVGLLRSEFLFLERTSAPDEDEQYAAYTAVIKAFAGEPRIVIRTLDVGGDKPLAYLPMPREENPFLGIRGIRLAEGHVELLRTQLRAILRASVHGQVHVMFPMVTTLDEWTRARALLEREREALGVSPVPAGIMVEVPAVALTAELFAASADFFSIGTNDLTQYTLAMDRGHPALASQVDALHPAVLQLIDRTVRAAHAHGRWVGVCGGLASEVEALPVLIGLGVDELSVSVPVVPTIKAGVRSLSAASCRALAARALSATSAAHVREILAG
jgi:phosphoenolpyruvate-protein phosphotransferase